MKIRTVAELEAMTDAEKRVYVKQLERRFMTTMAIRIGVTVAVAAAFSVYNHKAKKKSEQEENRVTPTE